ncbi:MAG: MarR family transcriptional regulator [Propionibacteriaceae bacterium]|nr:MarR family transcriptional regulator [Propionibacteriaceae bacterium]
MTDAEKAQVERTALFDALVHAEVALWGFLENALNQVPGSATLGRYLVLKQIKAADGTMRVQDIARRQHSTVGAASRLVDRLVSDGLVEREPYPGDRRAVRLRLTPEGNRRMERAAETFEDALREVLSDIDPGTLRALTQSLGFLAAAAERCRLPVPTVPSAGGAL